MRDTNPKTAFGATKPSVALIPSAALLHESLAMENGAMKYGPFNWRENSVSVMTYVHAAIRHLLDFADGVQDSADAGVHNLGHARACLGIVLDAEACGQLVDDRPKAGASAQLAEMMCDWKRAIEAAEKTAPEGSSSRARREHAVRVIGGVSAWISTCLRLKRDAENAP